MTLNQTIQNVKIGQPSCATSGTKSSAHADQTCQRSSALCALLTWFIAQLQSANASQPMSTRPSSITDSMINACQKNPTMMTAVTITMTVDAILTVVDATLTAAATHIATAMMTTMIQSMTSSTHQNVQRSNGRQSSASIGMTKISTIYARRT